MRPAPSRLLAVIAVLILCLLADRSAEARPRSASDHAMVTKLLGHADKLSAILEKHVDQPAKGLAAMDKYLRKHRKPMKKLIAGIVKIAPDLDDDARTDLRSEVLFGERTQRFIAALSAFVDKHGDNAAYAKKIDAHLGELETEGKKLFDAYMR